MQVNKRPNVIVDLSFSFAMKVLQYTGNLESHRKYIVARQLLRSGTSMGANIREAQNAESKANFIHKMKIAAKEAEETVYWFQLCQHSEGYPGCHALILQCADLVCILSKIIGTFKRGKSN